MDKYKITTILSLVLLLLVAGCKGNSRKEPETFLSNASRPTWSVTADYDYTSSMTAVVRIDLASQYPTKAADYELTAGDLLAAFIGDECVGVATPEESLFFLYISGTDNMTADSQVTLRYYSAHYRNIFEAANAFEYVTDGRVGSVSEPFVPELR